MILSIKMMIRWMTTVTERTLPELSLLLALNCGALHLAPD